MLGNKSNHSAERGRSPRWWLAAVAWCAVVLAPAAATAKPGFLVVAPDRGYVGNCEIREVVSSIRPQDPAALVFITNQAGYETAMRESLATAMSDLAARGASNIVVIPLFLFEHEPLLGKARGLVSEVSSQLGRAVEWAPVMTNDPLITDILADRLRDLGAGAPAATQALVAVSGTEDPDRNRELEKVVAARLSAIAPVGAMRDIRPLLFLPEAERDPQAQAAVRDAVRAGSTLFVPFTLGFRLDSHMTLWQLRFAPLVAKHGLVADGREVLPHPNVGLWLRKTINRYVAPVPEEIGIIVLAHGGGEYYDRVILNVVAPLQTRHRIGVAFGMADPQTLQEAADRLTARGVRRIVVVRLYHTAESLRAETGYVLGLAEGVPAHHGSHHGHGMPTARVRSEAVFSTRGGLESDPLIAEVLLERAQEVSRDPAGETVILLAHGAGDDQQDARWRAALAEMAEWMQAHSQPAFRAVHGTTLREDWPEKRAAAVSEIRQMIEKANQHGGRALLVPARFSGPGPYRQFLDGLPYVLNERGLGAHPNLTRWIEREIEAGIADIVAHGSADAGRLATTTP